MWYASKETLNFIQSIKDAGFCVRQQLIWNKNSLIIGRQDYQWKHEPCLYGWKEGAPHLWNSDRKQTTIIDCEKPQRNDLHPTMKPVKLFDYLIKNSTKEGMLVLDLFSGSGTTLIACEQNGRSAYLMEKDVRYADAIIDRWEKLTNQKATKVQRGNP